MRLPGPIGLAADAVAAVAGSGVVAPVRPDRLAGMALAGLRGGPTLATLAAVGAARHPGRVAVADDERQLTWAELHERVTAIARGLHGEHGVRPGDRVGILARNHAGFVEAALAASRCGADLVLLNTEFSAPQLHDVLAREGVGVLLHDEELEAVAAASGFAGPRPRLDDLAAAGGSLPVVRSASRIVLLTSGTTGTPKGAPRAPGGLAVGGPAISMLRMLPVRHGERIYVAPPLFHALGIAFLGLGLGLGMTVVLRRKFSAETALGAIEAERVGVVAAVPVMLQRIMAAGRTGHDTGSLRAVISGGSALPGDLAVAFMDRYGDVLFNLYGSTETGWASMASPADLRAAPGTCGRAPHGVALRILDDEGRPLPAGETGRIFMASRMNFEGYSGGGSKEVVDGAMSTGDVGHLDAEGRLFVSGRDDDMIVSGGENVFPQEVQETLAQHDAVADVAVVGVDDEEFGQRLAAFVVASGEVGEDELKAFVRERLARYKVPRDITFVDDIPRNATGKILKRALR